MLDVSMFDVLWFGMVKNISLMGNWANAKGAQNFDQFIFESISFDQWRIDSRHHAL